MQLTLSCGLPGGLKWWGSVSWYLACVKPNWTNWKCIKVAIQSTNFYWRNIPRLRWQLMFNRDLIYELYTIATHISQCVWYSDSCFPVSDAGLSPMGLWPGCSSSYPALLMECLSNWQEKWSEAMVFHFNLIPKKLLNSYKLAAVKTKRRDIYSE